MQSKELKKKSQYEMPKYLVEHLHVQILVLKRE
jgi:hypothetical protein